MYPDITTGARELVESEVNKSVGGPDQESPRSILTTDIEDKTLLSLTKDWKTKWDAYYAIEERTITEAENYWMGKQFSSVELTGSKRPIVDNLIFESLETFLPEATKQNPEPVVTGVNKTVFEPMFKGYKTILQHIAEQNILRLKLKRQTRYWSLNRLGVLKVGWNSSTRTIFTDVVRTSKLIMDSKSTINDGGVYTGEYIGEEKEATAEKLIEMFPTFKTEIEKEANNELGAMVKYTEWWTNELFFFTLKGTTVLAKYRNPHWNYDEDEQSVDEMGQPIVNTIPGKNHLQTPQMPYVFLSVFNLGKHPLDDTTLILQNLSGQDQINQTLRQMIKNIRKMNGGTAFASEAFTKEEAAEAQDALDNGDGVWVPTGNINNAFKPYQGTPLPGDVYNHLVDMRSELRNIFGVKGSSAQGVSSEQTVRGKIITSEKDASRIGGGVSEYIEQSADRVFNWWMQLIYVYFKDQDYIEILGEEDAMMLLQTAEEYPSLVNVSIKEGSMLPKDDLTKANQAVDLATAGLISPIDLYKALDFPDPMETARNLFMWQNMPQMLFPELAPQQPMMPGVPEGGNIPPATEPTAGAGTEGGAVPLPPLNAM